MFEWFRLWRTIRNARSKGLLHLRKADLPLRLDCPGGTCGLCCEVLGNGVVVSEGEAEAIGKQHIIGPPGALRLKSKGSICSLLKDKTCSCYAVRPKGCREYPWYRIEGELYYDRGCPGIKNDRDERPELKAIRTIEVYLPVRGFFRSLFIRWLKK